jgi:hypothetical protein
MTLRSVSSSIMSVPADNKHMRHDGEEDQFCGKFITAQDTGEHAQESITESGRVELHTPHDYNSDTPSRKEHRRSSGTTEGR